MSAKSMLVAAACFAALVCWEARAANGAPLYRGESGWMIISTRNCEELVSRAFDVANEACVDISDVAPVFSPDSNVTFVLGISPQGWELMTQEDPSIRETGFNLNSDEIVQAWDSVRSKYLIESEKAPEGQGPSEGGEYEPFGRKLIATELFDQEHRMELPEFMVKAQRKVEDILSTIPGQLRAEGSEVDYRSSSKPPNTALLQWKDPTGAMFTLSNYNIPEQGSNVRKRVVSNYGTGAAKRGDGVPEPDDFLRAYNELREPVTAKLQKMFGNPVYKNTRRRE